MSDKYDPSSHDAMFARLEQKLDTLAENAREHREETRAGFDKIATRTSDLEQWRDRIKGKLAIVSGAVSLFVGVAADWVRSHFGNGNG